MDTQIFWHGKNNETKTIETFWNTIPNARRGQCCYLQFFVFVDSLIFVRTFVVDVPQPKKKKAEGNEQKILR